MSSRFPADAVGVCPGTLLVESSMYDSVNIEITTRAAADAGFRSVALWSLRAAAYGLDATRALCDDAGIAVRAVEGATRWGAGRAAALEEVKQHLEVASALGANVLQAALLSPALEFDRAVDGFAALCERAQAHGVDVCIEFVPWFAVPDLDTAWRIVCESGASNGGICIDMLHWHRQPGGPAFDLLREIPGERIHYVQVCDAASTAPRSADEYFAAAVSARPLPGDGVVDIAGLVDALDAIGADPYFAFETFNAELARSGAPTMARRLRESARHVFG